MAFYCPYLFWNHFTKTILKLLLMIIELKFTICIMQSEIFLAYSTHNFQL